MAQKTSPFDYINSISSSRENQILSGELTAEGYNAFIINRGLSLYPDTVLYAQEMNVRPDVPAECQYHFLHEAVTKKKRWSKWPKRSISKDDEKVIDVLRKNYRLSNEKCDEVIKLLTDEQKNELVAEADKGQAIKKKKTL